MVAGRPAAGLEGRRNLADQRYSVNGTLTSSGRRTDSRHSLLPTYLQQPAEVTDTIMMYRCQKAVRMRPCVNLLLDEKYSSVEGRAAATRL